MMPRAALQSAAEDGRWLRTNTVATTSRRGWRAATPASVYDVLRGLGHTDCILPPSIVPLDLGMVAAGPVFTVRGRPDASVSAHETLLRWTELLARAPRGHVVMVQGHDAERALMGELSAETLQFRGVRGYIVDGGCRDTAFIRRLGFPVFCDKATPRDIVGAWVPVAYDEPISFGQVVVAARRPRRSPTATASSSSRARSPRR